MGLFDSTFSNLPKIAQDFGNSVSGTVSGATSSASGVIGSAISFTVASAQTKVSEAASTVGNVLGNAGGAFSTLGANMPSFETMKAAAMKAGSILVGGTGELVQKQIAQTLLSGNGDETARSISNAAGATKVSNDHLYTLTELGGGTAIRFAVMPEVQEARTIQYEAVAPAQFPGAFQKYKGTDSVQWTVNVTLIARNTAEATSNLADLNTLRGWTMPFFGDNTAKTFVGKLGAPPPVLIFKGLRKLIAGPVPVVITNLTWTWPKDVDYLPTSVMGDDGNPVPFPAVMTVAIQCVESWSTSQFNKFDLAAYRLGDMDAAFNTTVGGNESSAETARLLRNSPTTPTETSDAGGGQSTSAFAAIDPRRTDYQMGGQSTAAFAYSDPRRVDRQ